MIRGELVNLRAIEPPDAALLFDWLNNPEVMTGWGIPEATISRNAIQRRIEDWLLQETELDRPAAFIIETLDQEPAGLAILGQYLPVHRSAEISLLIGEPARWGRGLGGDALGALIDACFEQWGLHRLWIRCEIANERALGLYQRLGFTREATHREASFHDGKHHDLVMLSLLATDPR